ncbi:P-loop NTPase family protein [Streptomyces erythrochromogenes]|uniref:hypothetical protein n=1 Tax=Streptomyces erythrochromogenes TaxID=285574 RepID=UPI00381EA20C
MERILVVGVTGAGNSTLAGAVSSRLGLPYVEMDALYLTGPDWATNARWAWSQHRDRRREVGRRVRDPRFAPLETLRFAPPKRPRPGWHPSDERETGRPLGTRGVNELGTPPERL